ncbi:MAG: cation diffusion facilitator family transporter [Bacteroidales bacterium]
MGDHHKPHSNNHRSHNHHNHNHAVNEKNLLAATMLNLVITIVEVAGGILSGSLALLSDALHNLSDTVATFIAYLATLVGRKEATARKTFGYKRVEILAALLNAVILVVMCVFLLKEAWERWKEPQPIDSMVMLVVALVGLLANLFAVIILKKDAHKSINVKAAYVHLIGDTLSSVVVIIDGVLIFVYRLYWIDPLITLVISLYIIREAFVILKESVRILMQSAPEGIKLESIRKKVERYPGVRNMHHLHAWSLTDNDIHFEAHVELEEDKRLSEVRIIRKEIESLLRDEYGIRHITLQFEFESDHPPHMIQKEPTG